MQIAPKIILGIDPGTLVMGYGIIAVSGNTMHLISMGVIKLSSKDDAYERLEKIYSKVSELIKIHQPDSFAIEAPFFGKNVQSMLKLGRAQGVAIAAAMQTQIPITEYSPKKVKQSVTGNGNASKDQVFSMLKSLFQLKENPTYLDASDALAVAVCHHFQNRHIKGDTMTKAKDWKDFLQKNPEKVKKKIITRP